MMSDRIHPLGGAADAPPELRDLKAWLIWRRDGKRKIPYYADGARRQGKQNSDEDVARLVTFAEARKAAVRHRMSGVGLALRAGLGVVALDCDGCVDDHGRVREDVEALVQGTYAELSPSGCGIRAFFMGELPSRKSFEPPFSLEVFSSSGFVTFTGDVLPGNALLGDADHVAPLAQHVLDVYRQRFGAVRERSQDALANFEPPVGMSIEKMREQLQWLDPDATEPEWVRVCWAIGHETDYSEEGRRLWHEWSAGDLWDKPVRKYDEEVAEAKWNGRQDYQGALVTFRTVLDWAKTARQRKGTEALDAVIADADEDREKARYPAVQPFHEFIQREPAPWLVKGLLRASVEVAMVYGASGAGKTFWTLDLAIHLALGRAWRDKRVRQRDVFYACMEGASGFIDRSRAWCAYHGVDASDIGAHFSVYDGLVDLCDPQSVAHLIAHMREAEHTGVAILDTFARATSGANENSGEDMGTVLLHCQMIVKATGCLVILIHHAGKDAARGARGWSGLKAAMDAEIEISAQGEARRATITKMKDGSGPEREFGFKLQSVDFGLVDEDGDPITSAVVLEADVLEPVAEPKGKWQRAALHVIRETPGLTDEGVVDGVLEMIEAPETGRDRRREYAARGLSALESDGFVCRNSQGGWEAE